MLQAVSQRTGPICISAEAALPPEPLATFGSGGPLHPARL